MIEIATDDGVVTSTSSALAEAMADLIAAEHRATEDDLLAAVGLDLEPGPGPGRVDSSFAPRTAA